MVASPEGGHRVVAQPITGAGIDRRLLDAVVAVAAGLELEPALRRIVQAASDLTGAPYAALGVLGEDGLHRAFVYTGIDARTAAVIGAPPRGRGVLGHITRLGRAVRVEHLSQHPASVGFPPGHPPMESFLGVPVGIGDRPAVGNLYLADKGGGFTAEDEDVVVALAAAAAAAVENARLYEEARRREAWMSAAQEIATLMLSGAEEDEALDVLAGRAREIAGAATAALVLPGWGGNWVLEVATGDGARDLVGTVMPPDGRAVSVIASGQGMSSPDLGSAPDLLVPALRRYGPALYAPLLAGEDRMGVLLLLRPAGAVPFTAVDLATAQTFAEQAALVLQLAEGRRRAGDAELLEQRHRIARDLHDLVVQELFALGMRLNRLRDAVGPDATEGIDSSLASLDRVVRQIRATIRSLRDPDEPTMLTDRLMAEVTRAQEGLGFLPRLLVVPDSGTVDRAVPADAADDVVAVVREGLSNAARHSGASSVGVTVAAATGSIEVTVVDDGSGLPPDAARRSGLANLRERAHRHGGTFLAERLPEGGTTLRWSIPVRG